MLHISIAPICILIASPNSFLQIHYNLNFIESMLIALLSDCRYLTVGTISHLKYECLTQQLILRANNNWDCYTNK